MPTHILRYCIYATVLQRLMLPISMRAVPNVALFVQRIFQFCLIFAILCSCDLNDAANIYHVKDKNGVDIGWIQMKASFKLDSTVKIKMPNNITGLGTVAPDNFVTVEFVWNNSNSNFKLFFNESGGDVFLMHATLTNGNNGGTWNLDRNLGESNASYQCSYLFALSTPVGSKQPIKLILETLRIQVYNFHSHFSDAVICDEDKAEMPIGNWKLVNTDGTSCLRLNGAISFNITYTTKERHSNFTNVNLPPSAVVMPKSFCHTSGRDVNTTMEQLMVFGFYDDWELSLHFTRDPNITHDNQGDHWMVDRISLNVVFENFHFPNTINFNNSKFENQISSKGEGALGLFRMRSDRSYSCNAIQEKLVVANFAVLTQFIQVQPFMYHPEFLLPESCAADMMVSDVVPIIIGAALAILIVVVLVAYLIGRARTRRQTYENI